MAGFLVMYELPCFHLEVEQDTIVGLWGKKAISVQVESLDPNARHALFPSNNLPCIMHMSFALFTQNSLSLHNS